MDLFEKIPNNVNLSHNRRLQRALERWQPNYMKWWKDAGPADFQADDVYLRTAISVDSKGWANFDYVKMPDYKWGIFLAEPENDRRIPCGDDYGKAAWQEVPGEFRNHLRRIIVTQGDTEPASVEQQRLLSACAPSMYDCRNLFQVNVEEGRHLWAMVYLLHAHFGRDGREEAEELLERRSGDFDKPRILTTFNESIDDWLSFFMFTMFTDRDGKYQLLALAESGFDALSRTTRFMLTEEAHHMFVGETGVGRVVKRACQLMKQDPNEDARAQGGLDLDLIQRYINFWYSSSLDLFGGEISSNAADYFAAGLKGRAHEAKKFDDHLAMEGVYRMEILEGDRIVTKEVAMRNAMNEILRDAYVDDNARGVARWNKVIAEEGIDYTLTLPNRRFNRKMGLHSGGHFDTAGRPLSEEQFNAKRDEWLPSAADKAHVKSLMKPVIERGKMANWIAAPARGINHKPIDFEYIRRV
jgi:benzoyl-CoA 2,3-dioxygenase component B